MRLGSISKTDGRPRFAASRIEVFPEHLYRSKYVSKDNTSFGKFDSTAVIGEKSKHLDLRCWGNIIYHINQIICMGLAPEEIDLSKNAEVDDGITGMLSNLDHYLTTLNLSGCFNLNVNAFYNISRLRNLSHLDISALDSLTNPIIHDTICKLSSLVSLNVSNCSNLSDEGLIFISKYLHNLEALFAYDNSNITCIGINAIITECNQLKELDVHNCRKLKSIGISFKQPDMIMQHVTKEIVKINVAGCPLSRESMDWICCALPNVLEANVEKCSTLTSSQLIGLSKLSRNLVSLHASCCTSIKKELLYTIARYNYNIKELYLLDIHSFDSSGVALLLECCPFLISFNISYCPEVNDNAFSFNNNQTSTDSNVLKKKSISNNNNNNNSNNNLILEKLCLKSCALTNIGVYNIAIKCKLLVSINISGHTQIQDDGIITLSQHCPKLNEIIICDCLQLTDRSIEAICISCKDLDILDIGTTISRVDAWGGRVKQYSDTAIEYILKYAKKLRELYLQNQCGMFFSSEWLTGIPNEKKKKNFQMYEEKKIPKFNQFSGHFHLQKIDLIGADEISSHGAAIVFSKCYHLSEVYLPGNNMPIKDPKIHNKVLQIQSIPKDKMTPAERVLFAERYDLRSIDFWMKAFRHLPYIIKGFNTQTKGLIHHPSKSIWIYRDQYYSRRILERYAISTIILFFRLNKLRRILVKNHIIWSKIRTFKNMVYLQRRNIAVRAFIIKRSSMLIAKKIHYEFYPRLHNALIIQMCYRRYCSRKRIIANTKRIYSATLIQKYARGMIQRLSDRNILTQIFMKLPPFWKDVITNAPNRIYRCGIESEQISELKENTQKVLQHIVQDIAKDKQLVPKLEILVQQPFDKRPYVSLGDGRKLAFDSKPDGIFRDIDLSTVHPYNMKFWPITNPVHVADTSTTLHDPKLNGFEVSPHKPPVLVCSTCNLRMLAIKCTTCTKGYCFYCAFRYGTLI